jgi:arsenate reductase-like glutaredoxin family protein
VALDEVGTDYEIVDIFRTPLSEADIRKLLGSCAASDLFSWRSPQARARGITPGGRTDSELLTLMAEEPRLIRRPIVRIGDQLIIGADIERIKSALQTSG